MIKDELEEFIYYNEIISNFSLSLMVFAVVTFFFCFGYNTITPDLTPSFILGVSTFITLTLIDIIKR